MSQSATQKIAYNTGVQTVGKVIITILGIISIGVTTRYLGASGYGMFNTALVYLSLFGIMADLGLFTIAVRTMSEQPRLTQKVVANTIALRGILGIAVFGTAIGVAWFLPYPEEIKVAIAIAALGSYFGLIGSSIASVFQAKLRMDYYVIADVIGRALALGAVLWVVATGAGFYAIVATAIIAPLVTFLISSALARRFIKLRLGFNRVLWKTMLKAALPLGGALVVSQLYFRADVILLSFLSSTADVGVYSAIYKLLDVLVTVPGFLLNAVFPILVARLVTDTTIAVRMLQKTLNVLLFLSIGIAFGAFAVAPDLMRLVGGNEFVYGADALRLTLFTLIPLFASMMFGTLYVSKNRQMLTLVFGVFFLFLNVVLNLFVIPKYGLTGAAAVTLITEALAINWYYIHHKRLIGSRLSLVMLPRLLLVGIATTAAMWPLREQFLLAVAVGIIVYVTGSYLVRAIDRTVLKELRPSN